MNNSRNYAKFNCDLISGDSLRVCNWPDAPVMGVVLTTSEGKREAQVSLSPEDSVALATHLITELSSTVDASVLHSFGVELIKQANARSIPLVAQSPIEKPQPQRRFINLSPLARTIYRHMQRAGSISAREAMADMGITSASLARRICDIEAEGFAVRRERRVHPVSQQPYTRYSLA